MRVLITRPAEEAARTVRALQERGHEAIVDPLLSIRFLTPALPEGPFAGLVATSGNGIIALGKHPQRHSVDHLPLYAVGARTAQLALEADLTLAAMADGDTATLDLLLQERIPEASRLLHIAGQDRAHEIGASLSGFRHDVAIAVLYAADSADRFAASTEALLREKRIQSVLHYSARTADAFVAAARGVIHLESAPLSHLCLSGRVAERLSSAGAADVRIAATRDEEALLALLEH